MHEETSFPAHPPLNPLLSSASPPECGRVARDDHQGRGYKKYFPSLPSPLAGEGEGEGYFLVDDKKIIPQKVMHIFHESVKIFHDRLERRFTC